MTTSPEARARIEALLESDRVVLFMKGTREMPQCGFSAATISVLDSMLPSYTTFNVLGDQDVREGIKSYSEWPTIPQLYIDKEFMGGCDIVRQMFNTGELHEALGLEPPDRTAPEITLSDAAAEMIRGALEGADPSLAVHLQIDGRWDHQFGLKPAEGHEVETETNGIRILMDIASAQRAKGLEIDVEEGIAGTQLRVSNPNTPTQ